MGGRGRGGLICFPYLGVAYKFGSQTDLVVVDNLHIWKFIECVIDYLNASDDFSDFTSLSPDIVEDGIPKPSTNNHDLFCIYSLY